MADAVRIGIIGTGSIASTHVKSFADAGHAQIVGVWNRTRQRAEDFITEHDLKECRVFPSWQELLTNGELDAVNIAAAPQLRRKPIVEALARGMHVLTEKPFATNLEDAQAIIEADRNTNVTTGVRFHQRFEPDAMLARRLVTQGDLGRLRHVASTWRISVPNESTVDALKKTRWRTQQKNGLYVIGELGSHDFDLIRFIGGQQPTRLVSHFDWFDSHGMKADIGYRIMGVGEGGLTWAFDVGFTPGPMWMARERIIQLVLEHGTVRLSAVGRTEGTVEVRREDQQEFERIEPTDEDTPNLTGHSGVAAEFIALCRGDGPIGAGRMLASFEDGFQSQRIIDAACRSDRTGEWAEVSE